MAVVQISRIQIRRGQKNQGTGLPQLSSGELGWAIDTQEMFVGALIMILLKRNYKQNYKQNYKKRMSTKKNI